MLLDLAEPGIQARITLLKGERVRLVLDYPREAPYRARVLAALSELLRPASPKPLLTCDHPLPQEADTLV